MKSRILKKARLALADLEKIINAGHVPSGELAFELRRILESHGRPLADPLRDERKPTPIPVSPDQMLVIEDDFRPDGEWWAGKSTLPAQTLTEEDLRDGESD